jgi:hypothetical protein
VRDGASSEECNKIIETSREQISLNHGVSLYAVCLLTQRSIPKTTSGKIARSWCRRAYLEGTLSIVKAWQSSTDPSTADEGEDSKFVDELPAQSHKLEIVTAHNAEVSLGASGEDDEGVVAEGSRLVAPFTAADIRDMGVHELEALLETKLVEVGGGSQGEQTDALKLPIDRHRSLMSLGLDSMTIVQFKGVLENRFVVLLNSLSICNAHTDFSVLFQTSLYSLTERRYTNWLRSSREVIYRTSRRSTWRLDKRGRGARVMPPLSWTRPSGSLRCVLGLLVATDL